MRAFFAEKPFREPNSTSPHASAPPSSAPGLTVCVGNSPAVADSPAAGAFYSAQAFVDTWIAAPRKPIQPQRIDYGPQYNGVGECPF